MKLFENGVGRPSNEIKKKRKIFISIIVISVLLLMCFVTVWVNNSILNSSIKFNKLRGNIFGYSISGSGGYGETIPLEGDNLLVYNNYILQDADVLPAWLSYNTFSDELTYKFYAGLSVRRFDVYIYSDSSQKNEIKNYTVYSKDCGTEEFSAYGSDTETIVGYSCQSRLALSEKKWKKLGKKAYIKVIAYNNASKKEENKLSTSFYHLVEDGDWYKLETRKSIKYTNKVKLNSDLSFKCPKEIKEGSYFSCSYKIGTKKYKIDKLYIDELGNLLDYFRVEKDKNGNTATFSFKINSSGSGTISFMKKGSKTVLQKVKIKKVAISLSCPKKIKVGEKIVCKTNTLGLDVKVNTNVQGLNVSEDLLYIEDFESDDKKSSVYRVRLGSVYNQPSTVTLVASKKGYKSVTRKVTVVREKTTTTKKKTTTTKKKTTTTKKKTTTTKRITTTTKRTTATKRTTTSDNNSKKANFEVSAVWKVGTNGKTRKFNIVQGKFGSKVKYVTYVVCASQSDCVRNDAWDYMKKVDSSAVTYKIKAKEKDETVLTLETYNTNIASQTYYIRRSTYDSNENILYYSIYKIKTASTPRKGNAGDVYNTTLERITGKFY